MHPALADAEPRVFWTDRPDAPPPARALVGDAEADLVVVGGGFTGLWAAYLALERGADPASVLLLEGERIAHGASGRNGGFAAPSLTHGLVNGAQRWPDEIDRLEALGRANLEDIEATIAREGIACAWQRTGELGIAVAPWQLEGLAADVELHRRHGHDAELLDREAVQARIASPAFLGAMLDRDGVALCDPARLAWGLRAALERRGARVHERTPATALRRDGAGIRVSTPYGAVRARRAVLATSAFPPLVRVIRRRVIAVWDYVLVTEPLDAARRAAVGWAGREGWADLGNRFHYVRLTEDDRILFGGWDAVYHPGSPVHAGLEQHPPTFARLAGHLFGTFPQLDGLRVTHRWGGPIDTCSRFCAFFGTAHGGRVAYAAGFTGLGVGASRFGARVALELLDGGGPHTDLEMVRAKPIPFPPEPLRTAAVALTQRELARADARDGRRGAWLRLLDRIGAGFDS
ncbi:MAG TPA: FAD-dependent oxidoreductase [Solirubrobacteraceae bacterium]|nr:FAD-dependent oxidoreductase [Solirubrobacteraceae bacterium]